MTFTAQELIAWARAEGAKHIAELPAGVDLAVELPQLALRLLVAGYRHGLAVACDHVIFKTDRKRIDNLMTDAEKALHPTGGQQRDV